MVAALNSTIVALSTPPMTADLGSLIVMLISLVVLIVAIAKFKIHPVFALILVGIGAALAFGFPLEKVVPTIMTGFGNTIGNIGIVIILGCTIGVILENTGGALVLADTILRWVGRKRTSLAMAISGYLVSIPVFSDSAIVILSPVARSLSARGGLPLIGLLGALNGGILATHTMVPPTPGPLAAAGTLGADLGLVIALGLVSSVFYTVAATLWCNSKRTLAKYPRVVHMENIEAVTDDATIEEQIAQGTMSKDERKKLPSAFMTFAAILVPVLLICIASFAKMAMPDGGTILTVLNFIGHPVIALFLGVLISLFLDTSRLNVDQVYEWFSTAVESSGFITLATGAAGAYGQVLRDSGVGTYLGNLIAGTGLPAVFVPFLVSLLLSVSNGSATVSLLTGSAIILPLMGDLGLHPVIATLAIAAGSSFFYHTNASHYWVVNRSNDLTIAETYETVSIPSALGSVAAGICVFLMSLVIKPYAELTCHAAG